MTWTGLRSVVDVGKSRDGLCSQMSKVSLLHDDNTFWAGAGGLSFVAQTVAGVVGTVHVC